MSFKHSDFINRELSWLEFNYRVLEEGMDKKTPILERCKFLAITTSNLDEFFMVRVAGIMVQVQEGVNKRDVSGLTPEEQLEKITENVRKFLKKKYDNYNFSILPKLAKEGIRFKKYKDISEKQKEFLEKLYEETIFPILTPMAIDASRPFPHLLNKSLNLVVKLSDGTEDLYSLVQVPGILKRYIEIPAEGERNFILLEELIKANIATLFRGYKVEKVNEFRITRNGDLSIDEDEVEDLMLEIQKKIENRKWGFPVRLEVAKNIPDDMLDFLIGKINIDIDGVYKVEGPLDLNFLMKFSGLKGHDDLRYEKRSIARHTAFEGRDIFEVISERDIVLHHPFQSFDHIVELIDSAANDPNVLAIKQTLYRVSGDSPIIKSLINAVRNGKQVTVLVELKARFDEERNIMWAKELEQAGCHVVYGLKGLKTHAKCLLIVRKEEFGIRRYVHLGTGNYNDSTAKLYTDIGLLSSDEELCSDASNLFNRLTGFSDQNKWKKIAVAPEGLRDKFYSLIDREIAFAKKGKKARIIAKMNSLVDRGVIEKLYEASRAGVTIDLIIRGACSLRSGIKNLSENISVYSIVGRYLEHSRIYYFENGLEPEIYLSSADWMGRNLNRRVETLFPVEDKECFKEVFEVLEANLKDNVKSKKQNPDGTYKKVDSGKIKFSCQDELYY